MDTVYSLSGEVAPVMGGADDAAPSVLQPGALVVGSVRQICLIRKISAGGAVLHADITLGEGRRLELELDTGDLLEGKILWRRGFEVGIAFDEPIDVLPIIARNLVSQPGERRRMPRVELTCPAQIETEQRHSLGTLRDIAQGGAKLDVMFPLQADEKLLLIPEGLRPVPAVVRWTQDRLAGVEFSEELDWQEMMPWLRARSRVTPADLLTPQEMAVPISLAPFQAPEPHSVQLNLPARVREGTRRWTIDVASLSSRSVEFECYAALRLGTLLWVVLPGLEGWPARIVAIEGYRFICEFTQPLHPAVLERILSAAKPQA